MVARLPLADKEHPDPREEYLDGPLRVDTWVVPGTESVLTEPNEEGAPSWWHGDEEASQSFFKAMGIDPTTWGSEQ